MDRLSQVRRGHRKSTRGPVYALMVLALSLTVACGGSGSREPAVSPADPVTTPVANPLPPSPPLDSQADRVAVRQAWQEYRRAMLRGRGNVAAGLVTVATFAHYERLRDLALTADREALKAEPLADQIGVLMLRVSVRPKALRGADGRTLFLIGARRGVIGKRTLLRRDLGSIDVLADAASAALRVGRKATPLRVEFVREGGTWRIDQTSLLRLSEVAWVADAERQDLEPLEYPDHLLAVAMGERGGKRAWRPVDPVPPVTPYPR